MSHLAMGMRARLRFMMGIILEAAGMQTRGKVGYNSVPALGQARGVMYKYATHRAVF